jgi:2,3-bisphosphoglycerate-dependent phosphoglycerate mutase
MSQSHIILVRHGEAAASWSDHPDPGLSKEGGSQAKNTGNELVNEILKYQLISSPKKRAVETMEIMIGGQDQTFAMDQRFIEIPSDNVMPEKKQNWLIEIFKAPIEDLPGSIKAWRNNLIRWVNEANGGFIITTHFMVINAVVSSLTNSKAISYFHPGYASRTEIWMRNGKLEKLVLGDAKKTVINL